MLKKPVLIGALIIAFIVCFNTVRAQTWKTAKYDTVWTPITSAQIQSGVNANAKDSVGLYQLWRRSSYQAKALTFFNALKVSQKQQPNNAVLAAMYRAVVDESMLYGDVTVTKQLDMSEYRSDVRRSRLEAAKKLDSKLWLNYMTEAKLVIWENANSNDPKVIEEQIRLTQRAIDLAPKVSFPYKQMGGLLSQMIQETGDSDAKAVLYYHKAEKLAPTNCAASFGLANHYRYVKPNVAERKKAIQAVYATIPPSAKLDLTLRKVLTSKGIPVPPGH